jgi:TPR repeat protein
VEQDDAEAGRWYLRAAEAGLPKDQYTVAAMFRWGRYGVQRDPAQMLKWYQRAANQGFAPAQYALGQMLAKGGEVPTDPGTAFQWLSLAIVNGSGPAKQALMELTEQMTPQEIEAAKAQMLANAESAPAEAPKADLGHTH